MQAFLLFLALGWGIFCFPLVIYAFTQGGFILGMCALAVIAGPCIALMWSGVNARLAWVREFSEFAKPASRLIHIEKLTGIALDTTARVVYVGHGDLSKAYSFEDVREWNSRHETAGEFVGAGNIPSALNALGANLRASRQAAANTGLFLRVRDTNAPEWRISMKRKADRDRWFEILTQAINEGRAVA
jgi:hypothetical protein